MGKTPARINGEYWNGGTNSWVSIADLSGYEKYVDETKEKITDIAVQECGMKAVPSNTVIMSFKLSLGKTAITQKKVYTNEAIMAFIPNGNYEILPDYLFYLLSGIDWSKGTNRAVMGATLNKAALREADITIPPIDRQRHIAAVLDNVSSLISLRRQQLAKLDELVKVRFVEMFGDPLSKLTCWPNKNITEVCRFIRGGGTPPKSHPEYFAGNIPWVSPKDMKSLTIQDSIDHITEDAIKNSSTSLIPVKSVLMVIRSGILKHSLPVAINTVPVTMNQDMKAFTPSAEITPEYLMYYFRAIEPNILAGVRGVTADNIDFKDFLKRSISVPPVSLQKQFTCFVEQMNCAQLKIQQSLDKLDVLKKTLMQEYFG